MDEKEFKLFFKNKSPLLYTYLLGHVVSSKVAEELMSNIFARFYRTRINMPDSLSREKWLLLITKKFMIDYFNWRTTEEGQQMTDSGLTSYECSHLEKQHNAQLLEWINSLSELDQVTINENIISDLPPPETRFNIVDKLKTKIKETEERERKDKPSTIDYFKDKIKKIKEKEEGNGKQSPKK